MNLPRFTPARLLADLNFSAKIWFGLFLLTAVSQLLTLIVLLRPRSFDAAQVVFVDGGGQGHPGNFAELSSLTNLHVRTAEDVAYALFNRHPGGFDQPERVASLFLPPAAAQARAECETQLAEYRSRQLRQKPEITRVEYLSTSSERILVTVFGQQVQAGYFNGQPFVQSVPFQLDLDLVPNPNLSMNGRIPLVVRNFRHENPPR